jgi:hypothetical protein
MIGLRINPNDWEANRRLSLALAVRAENQAALRTVRHALHELCVAFAASLSTRVILMNLVMVAALSTSGIWLTQSRTTPPERHTAVTTPRSTKIRLALVTQATNASIVIAASPF